MQSFDTEIKNDPHVFYFTRYVDDILILTSSQENENDFLDKINRNLLSLGLTISNKKDKKCVISVERQSTNSADTKKFNFLGYEYNISNASRNVKVLSVLSRKINIGLSKNKENKFKEKISKAFYAYHKNKNFPLLYDRLTFLTTNRNFKHKEKQKNIPIGIYYNYSKLNDKEKLKKLDFFMRSILFGHCGRLGKLVKQSISRKQKKTTT